MFAAAKRSCVAKIDAAEGAHNNNWPPWPPWPTWRTQAQRKTRHSERSEESNPSLGARSFASLRCAERRAQDDDRWTQRHFALTAKELTEKHRQRLDGHPFSPKDSAQNPKEQRAAYKLDPINRPASRRTLRLHSRRLRLVRRAISGNRAHARTAGQRGSLARLPPAARHTHPIA